MHWPRLGQLLLDVKMEHKVRKTCFLYLLPGQVPTVAHGRGLSMREEEPGPRALEFTLSLFLVTAVVQYDLF